MNYWVPLLTRRVFCVWGDEAFAFLQGMTTQDVYKVLHEPIFSVLLDIQGRFLGEFFAFLDPKTGKFWIDCDQDHSQALEDLFRTYGPLHQVSLKDVSKQWSICAAIGPQADALMTEHCSEASKSGVFFCDGRFMYRDPRRAEMGWRAIVPYECWGEMPPSVLCPSSSQSYRLYGFLIGIPDGASDLKLGRSMILDYGYHLLNSISWDKGCYRGQEVMARCFHQGRIKRSLWKISHIEGKVPAVGEPFFLTGCRESGRMGGVTEGQAFVCLPNSFNSTRQFSHTDSGSSSEEIFTGKDGDVLFKAKIVPLAWCHPKER